MTSKRYLKQTEFADLVGISRAGVTKAKVTFAKVDGKKQIDMEGHETLDYLQRRKIREATGLNQTKEAATPKKFKNKPPADTGEITTPEGDLKSQKLAQEVERIKIQNEKSRGELIYREFVEKTMSQLFSIHENQFKTLGVNLSPKISEIYSKQNEEKALDIMELFECKDKNKKTDIVKILNQGEAERVTELNNASEDSTMKILKNIKRLFDNFLKKLDELD